MAEIEKPFRPTGDPIALTSESPLHPRRTSRRIMVGPVPVLSLIHISEPTRP